ncbi:Cellobiose phosphorylase [Luteitalea pratensis]|uniref:Cellobiose phosphorylase n=1 Tax=Luteitalea pratensis TaxID=1855912 RepID=A0A143PMR7_LUTPR|nr:glucoamylase family protein [Luteitalea pratensis]AMY09059.1 Cellobiose phosphorylase [Luteitalea pratensis]
MKMHEPAVDPRVTSRVAACIGIVPGGDARIDLQACRRVGREAALALPEARRGHGRASQIRRLTARLRVHLKSAMARTYASADVRTWLTENARLLASAESEARDFLWNSHDYPSVSYAGAERPRVSVLAAGYLDDAAKAGFSEEGLAAFLRGAQDAHDLQLGELWAVRGALMLELLHRVVEAAADVDEARLPLLIDSIRRIGDANWKQLFAAVSVVDGVLVADPSGAYAAMDDGSRDAYRHVVSHLARHGSASEREVAEAAVCLADAVADAQAPGVIDAGTRRTHVGYYLVDDGLPALKTLVGYRAPLLRRVADVVTSAPAGFYLGGVSLVTLAIVVSTLDLIDAPATIWVAFLLLLLPAMQAAVEFVNALVPAVTRPRGVPKLDFSKGIPPDCETMVAVPALLLNEQHVHELVMDLEIRYLANRDPQLYFALLSDSVDAVDSAGAACEPLVPLAISLIDGLNARYGTAGRTPFYLFHRHRVYNASEQRWMGWERKRGKLLDLNRLLRGGYDSFPVKVGNLDVLPRIRYVITLDSDTQLPREAAHRLIGALAHPLNRAVIDHASQQVVEGYGILQPRIGISTQSASRSWLARLLSGQTGIDIYTRAISDPYQDLFGEGSYTGKGIYDVDAFHAVLEQRFPENALLSHDLIEGIVARAALVSDIELIDDYPTHFSAYSRRKHRWMRGDWQILRWLMPRVPDGLGRMVENHFNAISRWKILDNLRRSLLEPAMVLLLLAGWFVLRGGAGLWTALSIAMLLLPVYAGLAVSLLRAPWGRTGFLRWCASTLRSFARQHLMVMLTLTFLLYDALLALDAIVRSLSRVFVTRKRLLEWETAAETRNASGPKRAADAYLDWSPAIVLTLLAALVAIRPSSVPAASPVLALWFCARPLAAWLSRAPGNGRVAVSADDEAWLRTQAWRMWRYFREFSTAGRNWLIPDHVREDGVAAERLSPTNLGFLLNARVAAVHLGQLTVEEFARETRLTLDGMRKLPLIRGHVPNWTDVETCRVLDPMFVSTVDSGNLVASLWTLKQAATTFAREAPPADRLWGGIRDLARLLASTSHPGAHALAERVLRVDGAWASALPQLEELARHFAADVTALEVSANSGDDVSWWAVELVERLAQARAWMSAGLTPATRADLEAIAEQVDQYVGAMDFAFLYNLRKKTLSVGYDAAIAALASSTYDLLASEARIAAFVAIAKGDVPQDSWFHLGRTHVASRRTRVLASWTGTMFEYLMPAIWMRHYPRTLMQDSMKAIVRLQQAFTRSRNLPWGVSESGFVGPGGHEYGYAAFGLPDVALNPRNGRALVISPYSSFLALLIDVRGSLRNLRRIERLGWAGVYGLYEAVDVSYGEPLPVRAWMAHHQGMSLLAVCNVLCDNVLQQHFHAEPQVLATELLLHERVPTLAIADLEEWLVPPRPMGEETAV